MFYPASEVVQLDAQFSWSAGGYDMAKDPVRVQLLVVKMDDGSAYTANSAGQWSFSYK